MVTVERVSQISAGSTYDSTKVYLANAPITHPTWLDVKVNKLPPFSELSKETAKVREIALKQLAAEGIKLSNPDLRILSAREFSNVGCASDQVKSSKLFLVLVADTHLVTIHDGDGSAVAAVLRQHTSSSFQPLTTALHILSETLKPLNDIQHKLTISVDSMRRGVANEWLTQGQCTTLGSFGRTCDYIKRQLESLKALIASETTNTQQLELYSQLQNNTDVSIGQFKILENAIKDIEQNHQTAQGRQEVAQQQEANRLKTIADERKRRSDAFWQGIGGVAIPITIGLSIVDSFNLPTVAGIGVVACSIMVSALFMLSVYNPSASSQK